MNESGTNQWVQGETLEGVSKRYQVIGLLGQGGIGAVYRAFDPDLGRQVAIKFLGGALSPQREARFRREGQAAASLQHPGIVSLHSSGWLQGRPYLAYDLIEDAKSLNEAWEPLPLDDRLDLIAQVCDALEHAHRAGVVHRDLKPDNVLVDASGRAYLTDFGLAWIANEERLTQTGALMGTPTSMAPEQIERTRDEIGPATDVWALGVLLYQALTDDLPFNGVSFVELMAQIAAAKPRPPRKVNPEIPAALERVCLRALSSAIGDRQAGAAAFAEDMAQAREEASSGRALGLKVGLVALCVGALLGFAAVAALGLEPDTDPSDRAPVATDPTQASATPFGQPGADDPEPAAAVGGEGEPETSGPKGESREGAPGPLELVQTLEIREGKKLKVFPTVGGLWVYGGSMKGLDLIPRTWQSLAGRKHFSTPKVHRLAAIDVTLFAMISRKNKTEVACLEGGGLVTVWSSPRPSTKRSMLVAWRGGDGVARVLVAGPTNVVLELDERFRVQRQIEIAWSGTEVYAGTASVVGDTVALCGATAVLPGAETFDVKTGERLTSHNFLGTPDCLAYGEDGQTLFVGTRAKKIFVFGSKTLGQVLGEGQSEPGAIKSLGVAGQRLYAFAFTKKSSKVALRSWDLQTGRLLQTLKVDRVRSGNEEMVWDRWAGGLWYVRRRAADLYAPKWR